MRVNRESLTRLIRNPHYAWVWLCATLLIIGIYITFGPAEHSLGTHIRIVYLHGAWVWASLAAFQAAGILGGLGLLLRRDNLQTWSSAFGRTGITFWVSYLPLSLLAMQSNWNGLFLAEPRWKLALVFAVSGILLQAGLSLTNNHALTSALNLGYLVALMLALSQTPNVMHPASPILSSDALRIQLYFFGLVLLSLLAMWQMARWWNQSEPDRIQQ